VKLKVLPASVANMIAAGEVVQRPASVVKELMENAVDAGASQVSVIISDAGRTLIQVIDNGCGMSPSDAVVCFERHATSKIAAAEDLTNILSYGFRGEALASIAAVAEVTLKTRRAEDETATQVVTCPDGTMKTSNVSAPVGSSFAVRNLFYNTPARRKFLKSDNVEFKHILDEFTRVAVTRPKTGFSLSHNGREIFVLKPAKSLKFRILDLCGSNVAEDMVDVATDTSVVKMNGFVGRPDAARKTAGNQFFFVNGRYFRSAYFHKAVMKAYEEMMVEGMIPSYFIFLETNPENVDVNIHPAKTEIKFEDDSLIFQVICAGIRETLGRNSFKASIDFEAGSAADLPQLGKSFAEYRGDMGCPQVAVDNSYNPFDQPAAEFFVESSASRFTDRSDNYGKLFEDRMLQDFRAMTVQGRFIITPVASGLMVIHIRRAQERILYEKFLKALSGNGHVSQTALFPVSIQVGVSEMILLENNGPLLHNLGFDIVHEGSDSIRVNAVPEGFSCKEGEVRAMMDELLLILSEDNGVSLPELMTQKMALKFAAMKSSSSETVESGVRAQNLVDTLFACDNAEFTPEGKRIVCIIGTDELNSKFN